MFGPDMIPAAYLEERLAMEKAKREAEEKRQYQHAAATTSRAPSQLKPCSLSQVFGQQHPRMSRPGSSTVLGGIYQSLAKTATGTSTPTSSQPSRDQTPCPGKMTAEEKRAFDEKWREIDMMNMPKWH